MIKTLKCSILLIGFLIWPHWLFARQWEIVGKMQVARANMSIATIESPHSIRVFLIGGLDQSYRVSGICEVFTISNDGIINLEKITDSLKIPRYSATAFQYQGKIYLLGGLNSENQPVLSSEVYDPQKDQWEILSDSVIARQGAVSVVLQNMHYLIGGWSDYSTGFLAESFILQDSLDAYSQTPKFRFSSIANIMDARAIIGAATHLGWIYITGGLFRGPSNLFTRFDTITGDYQELTVMPGERAAHASVVYLDSIFVIGGFSLNDSSLAKVMALNLDLLEHHQSWSQLPSLHYARESLSAVVLFKKIYVFGGYNRNSKQFISGIESYGITETTGVDDHSNALIPDTFILKQNYPNPFNYQTRIELEIFDHIASPISLDIYTLNGRRVCTLLKNQNLRGRHFVDWDGRDQDGIPIAAGVYVMRLYSADRIMTKKLVRMR